MILDGVLSTRVVNCLTNEAPPESCDWSEDQWKQFVLSRTKWEWLRTPGFGRRSLVELNDWAGARFPGTDTSRALDTVLPTRARNFLYNLAPDGSDHWSESQWKDFARSLSPVEFLGPNKNFGRKSLIEIERWLDQRINEVQFASPELDRINEEIAALKAKLKSRQHMKQILLDILATPPHTSGTAAPSSVPGSSPSA